LTTLIFNQSFGEAAQLQGKKLLEHAKIKILNVSSPPLSSMCAYVSRDKYNMRHHLEGKHSLTSGYPCLGCGFTFKTKQIFTNHRATCGWKE
jgi:hypothetical protein